MRGRTALCLATVILLLTACSSPASAPAATPTAVAKATTAPAAAQTAAPAAATKAPAAGTQAPAAAATAKPAAAAAPLAADAAKLLTVADVERVTGLSGVRLIPYNASAGAGGDINFGDKDGSLILMLKLSSNTPYNTMKNDARYSSGPISGIGNDAFGIPSPLNPKESFGVAFLKGTQAATLSTYFSRNGLAVSIDKIQELAKLAASRMP